ncbi:MAG TPA: M23 family metallopeptidase [Thermoanaerobaculia bacterium]|nr:M23 family metallopeptidase [Thermoanaerobaculia bacterium]
MKARFALLFLLLPLSVHAVRISVLPEVPLIERGRSAQILNFDFLVENDGTVPATIEQIEMSVIRADGALVLQRRLAENGDSISTVPQRTIEPGAKIVIFNPFYELPDDVALTTLRYEFAIAGAQPVVVDVHPRVYRPMSELTLPLGGRVFVHDGHDFYSHHRRLDITGGMTTALHIDTNMTRFAYDFCVVDEQGRMHSGTGEKPEEWFGFGKPILAPADGVVVKAINTAPDHAQFHPDLEQVLADVLTIGGNYVVVDHGNGEHSAFMHMKQGSVAVKPGDRVKRGQKIGEMGWSGDAIFPHLHYQLQRDNYVGEGLPSYFRDAARFNGTAFVPAKNGQIDTGDIVMKRER